MRSIVSVAVAAFVTRGQSYARFTLMNLGGPITGVVDGQLLPEQRRRWRKLGGKLDAAETLVARGDRVCLLPGCDAKLAQGKGRRSYCSVHRDHERWVSELAAKRHDRRLESIHDLLDEVALELDLEAA